MWAKNGSSTARTCHSMKLTIASVPTNVPIVGTRTVTPVAMATMVE
jgi:hypothetical protein